MYIRLSPQKAKRAGPNLTTTTFLVRIAARGCPWATPCDVDRSRNTGRVPQGVVHANWNPRNRQVNVNWNEPGNSNDKLGARPAIVVIIRSFKLFRFCVRSVSYELHPTAEHLPDFAKTSGKFEITFVRDDAQLKTHADKEFQQFALCMGSEKWRFAERPGHGICLKDSFEEHKEVPFNRASQGMPVELGEAENLGSERKIQSVDGYRYRRFEGVVGHVVIV